MRTIGVIGGMSWHSSLEYYRALNTAVAQALGGHHSAPVLLSSVDFEDVRALQLAEDWDGAGALLVDHAMRLQGAGAAGVLIATNLMHKVAPAVAAAIEVPLLHIADAVADAALARGLHRLGVLGTRWVMEQDFYRERLAVRGVETVATTPAEAEAADRIIFEELTCGVVTDASRRELVGIARRMGSDGAAGVVLACTELGMILDGATCPLPVIDSLLAHTAAASRFVLEA